MCADVLQFNNVYEHGLKLEKIGSTASTFFKMLCLQKSDTVTKLLWLMFPDEICLISSSKQTAAFFSHHVTTTIMVLVPTMREQPYWCAKKYSEDNELSFHMKTFFCF